MELKNLLNKSVKEMTEEELEAQISLLTRSRVMKRHTSSPSKQKEVVSNKDRQLKDLIKGLTEEQVMKLIQNTK